MPDVIDAIGDVLITVGAFLPFPFNLVTVSTGFGFKFVSALIPETDATASAGDRGITQQVRSSIAPRNTIYGERRASGPIAYIGTTEDTKFLHIVIMLAAHEIEAIDVVLLDDYPIYDADLDGSGLVNLVDSRYEGLVRIKKLLGTADQAADADLVSEVAEWTTTDRLRGIACLYVTLEHDQDVFIDNIPGISCYLRGKKLFDPRDSGTRWSPTTALVWRDNTTSPIIDGGFGATTSEVDDSFVNAAANICEEFVAVAGVAHTATAVDIAADTMDLDTKVLKFQRGDRCQVTSSGTIPAGLVAVTDYYVIPVQPFGSDDHAIKISLATTFANALAGTAINITGAGSGNITVTKNGEPRYMASGEVVSGQTADQVQPGILSAMAGQAAYVGGVWSVTAGAFTAPTLSFDESDTTAPVEMQTEHSLGELFNGVKGVFRSPLFIDVPNDYPPVTNATYETEDNGERIWADLDQRFVTRSGQAQRLAKIALEKHRQAITAKVSLNLKGLQIQAGDVIRYSNTIFGWDNKEFEVVNWRWAVTNDAAGAPALGVEVTLRETASAVFDWNSGEETTQDPAPDTTLPNPFSVANPTGLAVVTDEFITEGGIHLYHLDLSWTAPLDGFVTNGGKIEIQFKKSADATFQQSYFVDGDVTRHVIPAEVQFGENYDMQIRSVNSLGARRRPAAWTQLFGFTAGAESGGADAQFDDGLITDIPDQFVDMGDIAVAADLLLDDGSIV